KGKLLKKFSLNIPFKTFPASADGKASLSPSARVMEKNIGKGFSRGICFQMSCMGRRERSASAILPRRPVKRFEEIQRETFSKVSLWPFSSLLFSSVFPPFSPSPVFRANQAA
ncbi:MAG TPA: hypothetical protein PLS19_13685, partial [bacterium]|nr:hypothetical protein [bacterium]